MGRSAWSVTTWERKPGVWYVHISWRGRRKKKKIGPKQAAEALAVELRKILMIAEARGMDAGDLKTILAAAEVTEVAEALRQDARLTVGEYAKQWLKDGSAAYGWKKSTLGNYRSIVKNHLQKAWGDVPLAEVSRRAVKTWCGDLSRAGKSPKTVKNIYRCLSSILSSAADDEHVSHNPIQAMGRVLPKVAKDKEPPRAWRVEQLARILKAAEKVGELPLFATLAGTGMRIGEVLALKWTDIDYEAAEILVRRSRVRGETDSVKNRGYRVVRVSERLVAILRQERLRRERQAFAKGKAPGQWVFVNSKGKARDSDNVRHRVWKSERRGVLKKAKVPDHGLHGFRHTWASHALASGRMQLFEVSRQLGHAQISTTADTYGHIMPRPQKATVPVYDLILPAPQHVWIPERESEKE